MNRRSFLKAIAAFVGTAAVPAALVEACQIDAPIPDDWIVGLLDPAGRVLAQAHVRSLDEAMRFPMETAGTIASIFVEGGYLPARLVSPLLMADQYICVGIGTEMHITELTLTEDV